MEACPEGRRGLISAFGFLITQTAGNRLTWIHRTRAIPATGSVKTRAPSRDTLARNNDGMDQLRVTTHIVTWLSPTSAGFGAESFVHAGLDFLSVTISAACHVLTGLMTSLGIWRIS